MIIMKVVDIDNALFDLHGTSKLRKLFRTVLVLPFGGEEAEMELSIMNHILDPRRYRSTPVYVNDFMNIRISGPNDLNNCPACSS